MAHPSDVGNDEACLVAAVNAERAENVKVVTLPSGVTETVADPLGPLPVSPAMADYARSHSEAMALYGRIYHTGSVLPSAAPSGSPQPPIAEPDGQQFFAALPAAFDAAREAAENVGYYSIDDCRAMAATYFASPPHRANILNPRWTAMGIGVAMSPSGALYSTEDFADMSPPVSPSPAPVVAVSKPSPRPTSCG